MKRRSKYGYCGYLVEWVGIPYSTGSLIVERHKFGKHGRFFAYCAYPYLWDDIGTNAHREGHRART